MLEKNSYDFNEAEHVKMEVSKCLEKKKNSTQKHKIGYYCT